MATGRIPTTANSPLTAKGDLFTFSTGSAKLAVGNDGETLVADSSTSTGLAYREDYAAGKNKFINGDLTINQRAFSSTTTTGTYTFDRWACGMSDGTVTVSAQVFTPGSAPVAGYEFANYVRIVTSGQTATSASSNFVQRIEDIRTFAGQTVTVSFWAKAATGTPQIAVGGTQNFGTSGSSFVRLTAQKVTLSTSWARYSATLSVPSISGKTIGTGNSTLIMEFWVSSGSDFATRTDTLGIQNNTFEMAGFQVEEGSVATAFQTATGTIQGELAACQRYYVRYSSTDVFHSYANGMTTSTTVGYVTVPLPVEMRTAPTTLDTSTVTKLETYNSLASNKVLSAIAIDRPSTKAFSLVCTITGATNGQVITLRNSNDATAFFGVSAEL